MTISTAAWFWPQWTLAVFILLHLYLHSAHNGEPRSNYNFALALIDAAITVFILGMGGFFA